MAENKWVLVFLWLFHTIYTWLGPTLSLDHESSLPIYPKSSLPIITWNPNDPYFVGQLPKTRPKFQPKQGSSKGSRYTYPIHWVYPLPSNSHHQDYYIFRIGNPNLNLHLPLASWEGGQPNVYIPHGFFLFCFDGLMLLKSKMWKYPCNLRVRDCTHTHTFHSVGRSERRFLLFLLKNTSCF